MDKYPDYIKLFFKKNQHWILILVISLIIRIFFLINNGPLSHDEAIYLNIAKNLYESQQFTLDYLTNYIRLPDSLPMNPFFYQPLYPILVSIISFFFGETSVFAGRFVSLIFGSLIPVIIYLLSREITNRNNALIIGILTAFFPFLGYTSSVANADSTAFFFFFCFLLFLIRYSKNFRLNEILLSFLFLVLAYYCKMDFMFFAVLFILPFFFSREKKQKFIIITIIALIFLIGAGNYYFKCSPEFREYIQLPIINLEDNKQSLYFIDDNLELSKEYYESVALNRKSIDPSQLVLYFSKNIGLTLSHFYSISGIFLFFSLIGMFVLFRKNKKNAILIIGTIIISICFYSLYPRISEIRYIVYLFPIFLLLSIIGIDIKRKKILEKFRLRNVFLVLFIILFFIQYYPYYLVNDYKGKNDFSLYKTGEEEIRQLEFKLQEILPQKETIMTVNIEMCNYLNCYAVETPTDNYQNVLMIAKKYNVSTLVFRFVNDSRVNTSISKEAYQKGIQGYRLIEYPEINGFVLTRK